MSIEIKETKCKECQIAKLNNPKHPICNYHQGIFKGKAEARKEFLEIIDNIEIQYPDDDGKPFDRLATDFQDEIKQKIKELEKVGE
jgi:hypothetical protein